MGSEKFWSQQNISCSLTETLLYKHYYQIFDRTRASDSIATCFRLSSACKMQIVWHTCPFWRIWRSPHYTFLQNARDFNSKNLKHLEQNTLDKSRSTPCAECNTLGKIRNIRPKTLGKQDSWYCEKLQNALKTTISTKWRLCEQPTNVVPIFSHPPFMHRCHQ